MSDPRTYTGDLPPGGPDTVDALVLALMDAVQRVRLKYGVAVDHLAAAREIDASTLMTQIDAEAAERAALLDLI
jgi:hypothetical protein